MVSNWQKNLFMLVILVNFSHAIIINYHERKYTYTALTNLQNVNLYHL